MMRTRRIRQLRRQSAPRPADYAAPLRRWLGRGLSRVEARVFYALERQRIIQGHIRINIVDRDGADSRQAIRTYLLWLAHIDRRYRDIAIIAPVRSQALTCARQLIRDDSSVVPLAASALARYPLRGRTYCAAVFLDAHFYGIGPNLARSVFSVVPDNGVVIVHSRRYSTPLPPAYETDSRHMPPPLPEPEPLEVDVLLMSFTNPDPPPDPPPHGIRLRHHRRQQWRQLPPHLGSLSSPAAKSTLTYCNLYRAL